MLRMDSFSCALYVRARMDSSGSVSGLLWSLDLTNPMQLRRLTS
jgi:hypothetical protein